MGGVYVEYDGSTWQQEMQHLASQMDRLRSTQNILLRHAAKYGARLSRHENECRARFLFEVFKRAVHSAFV